MLISAIMGKNAMSVVTFPIKFLHFFEIFSSIWIAKEAF